MKLLDDATLAQSSVVANCCMNRGRPLLGSGGYAKELGFDPLARLRERLQAGENAAWLDLCCGEGRALREAAQLLHEEGIGQRVRIVGVDLVSPRGEVKEPALTFVAASLAEWQPAERFDLVTCVHGLHYLGDKLKLLARAVSWLAAEGLFAAHLDLSNIRLPEASSNRTLLAMLRQQGFQYDRRRKLVTAGPSSTADFRLEYLGADDTAGSNYTGQPAVTSHYR